MNIEEHLKSFKIFQFKNFDEIENFAYATWSKPSKKELKFLNHRQKADPSSSLKDNLKFFSAVGKSEMLQSLIFSERYGSYVSSSSFVIKNLHGFKKILDIGCSTGYLTSYYALKFPMSSFIGIDFSLESVNRAKRMKMKLNINNVDFFLKDMNCLDYPDKYFDCLVDTQSIYYSKNYLKTFIHLKKILSDEGLLITIPGIGDKDLISQYINQIERSGFFIQDFEFIETKNLSKVEYLPAISCSLRKPIEKVNIDQIINRIFDSL